LRVKRGAQGKVIALKFLTHVRDEVKREKKKQVTTKGVVVTC